MATLLVLRQTLARALDDIETYTVSSAAPSQIAANQLVNNTTGASTARYNERWVYVNSGAAAGQQRRVINGSYVPATGALGNTPPWDTTPVAAQTFELTGAFPSAPSGVGADTDYRSILNRALALLYVRWTDTVSISTNTYTDLTANQIVWLTQPDQVIRWTEPAYVTSRAKPDASWRGIRLVFDAAPQVEVRAPLASVGDLTLEAWCPAVNLVNGAVSSTGLSADTDTSLPRVNDVVLVALMECYQVLANRNPGRPTGNWRQRWRDQTALVQSEHARRSQMGDRTLEMAAATAQQQQQQAA